MAERKPLKHDRLTRVEMSPSSLVANPRNPRIHPQEQLERLAASLRQFGKPKPVLARKANKMLIAGHGVTEAAKLALLDKIDVVLWDIDQATADAFMLADNRQGELSYNDDQRVAELLGELGEIDKMAVGFSEEEAAQIMEGLESDIEELSIDELDTSRVDDRFWITIRGPLTVQDKVLKKMKAELKDLDGVEVDLGTIAIG